MATLRHATDSNDDQYKVPLSERFSSLSTESRQRVVARIPRESCRPLAERLLLHDEVSAALNRQDVPYPASEIVDAWSRKRCSAIWILRDALDSLRLDDALAELEKARFDYVTIYAVIMGDRRAFKEVPGRKPLKEIIRPTIYRQLGINMTQNAIQVLRLARLDDFEQELTWSSPAMLFKAQQIDITVEQRKIETVHRHTDKAGKLQDKVRVDRNVISWIESDLLFFEYDLDGGTSSTQPDLDLVAAAQEQSKERLSDGMAEMSLSSTEKPIFGETRPRISSRKDRTATGPASTPSCHCVEISNEDTLREHLVAEGDFVVQQIQTDGCKTLCLIVLHGGHMLQYPITTHCCTDGEDQQFSISDTDHSAAGVDQLLNYYQDDGHHLPHLPSLPPVQVQDDFVYLKRNRTVSLNYSCSSS